MVEKRFFFKFPADTPDEVLLAHGCGKQYGGGGISRMLRCSDAATVRKYKRKFGGEGMTAITKGCETEFRPL
jgi:hypothetical protein